MKEKRKIKEQRRIIDTKAVDDRYTCCESLSEAPG